MSTSALEDSEVLTFVASDLHLHLRKDGVAHVARKVFDCFVEAELRHTTPFRDMPARQLKQLVSLLSLAVAFFRLGSFNSLSASRSRDSPVVFKQAC